MSRIRQEVDFPQSPSWVYDVLLDPRRFAALSRAAATGDATEGAAFSQFGGHVTGRHIELVPDKRIVQAWRVRTWPEGVYSIVRFEFESQQTPNIYGEGTSVVFEHDGFPPEDREELSGVWRTYYWDNLLSCLC